MTYDTRMERPISSSTSTTNNLVAQWEEYFKNTGASWSWPEKISHIEEMLDLFEEGIENIEDPSEKQTNEQDAARFDQESKAIENNIQEVLANNSPNFNNPIATRRNPGPSVTVVNTILGYQRELQNIEFELQQRVGHDSQSGFSAVGRANNIQVMDQNANGFPATDHWFQNTTVNGNNLINFPVYKQITNIDLANSPKLTQLPQDYTLVDYEHRLNKPVNTPQMNDYTSAARAADRNGGQAKNMGNVNAATYAHLAGIQGYQTKNWEWLHIRAASLGGKTDGTNLVAGTRDANTHMMPFESHIAQLTRHLKDYGDGSHLKVTWEANDMFKANTLHAFKEIKIDWQLQNGNNNSQGEVKFKPLETNQSLSKAEVKKIEDALKDTRAQINNDNADVDMDVDMSQ